ncbi:hypothetical protein ACOMHN_024146 [Nucella lapillus]
MTHPHHLLLPFLLLLLLLPNPSLGQDQPISVKASIVTVEQGHTAEVTCSTTETKPPRWYRGANATGETLIPEDGAQRVFSDLGILIVQAARINDSGTYLCRAFSAQRHSATVQLRVYVMPSYLTEGFVILGIGAALLVVFVAGALIQRRSRTVKRHDKRGGRSGSSSNPNPDPGCMICELF